MSKEFRFTHFAGKFSLEPRVQGRVLLRLRTYLSLGILILKFIFPLKVAATLLSGPRKGAVRV